VAEERWVARPARRQWLPGIGREYFEASVTSESGAYIASVTGRAPTDCESRARLLAAAPALADALGFLCEVVRGIPAASMPPEIYSRVIEGLDDARAALRAARRGEC
jgi:hypothetical protein